MVIEKNYKVNNKTAYKKNSFNFMYIYRNHLNILGQKKLIKLGRMEYLSHMFVALQIFVIH